MVDQSDPIGNTNVILDTGFFGLDDLKVTCSCVQLQVKLRYTRFLGGYFSEVSRERSGHLYLVTFCWDIVLFGSQVGCLKIIRRIS